MGETISPEAFDGLTIWQSLTDEQRGAIGAAALELVAAHFCLEETHDGMFQTAASRAADAAAEAADKQLHIAFVEAVLQTELTDGEDRLKFPAIVGMICHSCGCTQNDACPEGCGWAKPNLCTACVPNVSAAIGRQ